MRIAKFRVTAELLIQALCLPPGTKIQGISTLPIFGDSPGQDGWDMELTVEHPDLKEVDVDEGESAPTVKPMLRRQDPVVFEGWGQS